MRDESLQYSIVRLGRDYEGRITDFAEARNSFIEKLKDGEYILFLDDDVEASKLLLDYLDKLEPKYDWYDVRQINLRNNKYSPLENPFFTGILTNNKARYRGRVHERLYPQWPHGYIDLPVIHNHVGAEKYVQKHPIGWRPLLLVKKLIEIAREKNREIETFEEWMQRRVEERL